MFIKKQEKYKNKTRFGNLMFFFIFVFPVNISMDKQETIYIQISVLIYYKWCQEWGCQLLAPLIVTCEKDNNSLESLTEKLIRMNFQLRK